MNDKETIRQLFLQYPDAKEVYRDAQGVLWVNKKTAELQSKDAKPEILKRTDYLQTKKIVKDGTESNN